MEKLKMQTENLADKNYEMLAKLFPNAVTETIDENGEVVRAIDADVLRQEISTSVVEGREERYQFTWPDKKKAVLLANSPVNLTLRPVREKSVGRDGTEGGFDSENIYIEGDNLDALKLLRNTYLGKVKMIYIDPPYNTGNDFVYADDFAQSMDEYMDNSGQFDEEGNRLVQNTESNGRYHTDWLNMMYPRLKVARDLMAQDGIIFISIDENEVVNMRKICDEVFGQEKLVAQITLLCNPKGRSQDKYVANCHEYVLIYSNSVLNAGSVSIPKTMDEIANDYSLFDEKGEPYRELELRNTHRDFGKFNRPKLWYPFYVGKNGEVYLEKKKETIEVYPYWDDGFEGCWTWGKEKAKAEIELLVSKEVNGKTKIYRKAYAYADGDKPLKQVKSIWNEKSFFTEKGQMVFNTLFETKGKVFQSPKSVEMIKQCTLMCQDKDAVIMDFFSGSGTAAHAVMEANAEDSGNRHYIMVQISEPTYEAEVTTKKVDAEREIETYTIDSKTGYPKVKNDSEARKAGYYTICDIGEERIRRAGKKIKEETGADIDYGFRVFQVASSNMEDVYYRPEEVEQLSFGTSVDNIKSDRSPEDLLFQVMLDLGVLLSEKIEETEIDGKKVFDVGDGFLIACFDDKVTDETVKAIAQKKPRYAVFRDSSMADDSVMTNFDQIFETYSKETVRKVL